MKLDTMMFSTVIVGLILYLIIPANKEPEISIKTVAPAERVDQMKKADDKSKYIHAGADELYPDEGYDQDGWSNRGYMSAAEMNGSHLNGDANKLQKLVRRKISEKEKFVAQIAYQSKELSVRFDVPASIIAAQAILESGYGTSRLAVVANNLFGHMGGKTKDSRGITGSIKAYDKNINGHTITYGFRIYESKWWSIWNHAKLLSETYGHRKLNISNKRDAWLAALCGCSDNRMLASDAKKLADNGGFLYASACAWPASDSVTSRYISELRYIIKSYNLEKLDE
jgi:flagellum-specific peptidoglycan hydrolase FlgJ